MAPVNLRYLDRRPRNGKDRWYFRHPKVERTRIPGQPGEPAFQRKYAELLSEAEGERLADEQRQDETSIRTLADAYQASDEWEQLRPKTQHDYKRELNRLCRLAGDLPYSRLSAEGIRAMRKVVKAEVVTDRKAAIKAREESDAAAIAAGKPPSKRKPPVRVTATTGARASDLFKSTVSAMLSWAVEHEMIKDNPAIGIKKLHRKKNTESRKAWTEHQIQVAINHGPRHIADGVVLGVYTGQRLGTCCNMVKSQSVGPLVRIRQEKTGNLVDVRKVGPLVDLIARRLGANDPDDAPQLLLQGSGKRYTERLYSDHLRKWLDAQGWTDISFHGLRYSAAGTLNEAGASVATIVSVIGHSTYDMAIKYLSQREEQERAGVIMKEVAKRRESGA